MNSLFRLFSISSVLACRNFKHFPHSVTLQVDGENNNKKVGLPGHATDRLLSQDGWPNCLPGYCFLRPMSDRVEKKLFVKVTE